MKFNTLKGIHRRTLMKWMSSFAALLFWCRKADAAKKDQKPGANKMQNKSKSLHKVLSATEKHWVGDGFWVSTMFSVHRDDYHFLTPFILLDYAEPRQFSATSQKRGVGPHPHRGFETVTFAVQGSIDHRDSAGGGGRIEKGDVQWMTAGSGVVHEEFHGEDFAKKGGLLEMLQLWVNFPKVDKMTEPRYQPLKGASFPVVKLPGDLGTMKFIAGEIKGYEAKGPAKTYTPIDIVEAHTTKAGAIELPLRNPANVIVILIEGTMTIEGQKMTKGQIALFNRDGDSVSLGVGDQSRVLILSGEPIDEPAVAYGPFVMNTKQEIADAFKDFKSGKMGHLSPKTIKE